MLTGYFFLGCMFFNKGFLYTRPYKFQGMILRDRNFRHYNKIGGKISGREVRGLVTSKIILHFHLLLPIYRKKKKQAKKPLLSYRA